jgi:hypothetical protein
MFIFKLEIGKNFSLSRARQCEKYCYFTLNAVSLRIKNIVAIKHRKEI